MRTLFLAIALCLASALSAQAQNTGGVFPPDVNEGHKSAQYRIAINLENDRFAQRLHYQQSLSGDLMWRIIGQTRETASSDFDFDFVQAELFWQISADDSPYRTGLRFDARLRDDNRPGQFGLNWMNQWDFNEGWSARLVGLSAVQVGENRADGIFLSPRAQIAKKLESGPSIGLEYYGSFGNTEDLDFGKAGQTVGPYVSTKLVGKTSAMAGVQFGLTDAAPNTDLRLWLTQGF